ncbi:hypothetical protein [Chromobacterium phragmitis]|uniref:Uncharacterized protein n=1 Tax=Chromobacterium phragmitis TaxID=2202141 RepID=A0ABV0IZF3_9NEIS|nr:hypothetical protein [Chromobacterium phragmitis]
MSLIYSAAAGILTHPWQSVPASGINAAARQRLAHFSEPATAGIHQSEQDMT